MGELIAQPNPAIMVHIVMNSLLLILDQKEPDAGNTLTTPDHRYPQIYCYMGVSENVVYP